MYRRQHGLRAAHGAPAMAQKKMQETAGQKGAGLGN
jgi:hypothetical protein